MIEMIGHFDNIIFVLGVAQPVTLQTNRKLMYIPTLSQPTLHGSRI
jgi:hypothetical protein